MQKPRTGLSHTALHQGLKAATLFSDVVRCAGVTFDIVLETSVQVGTLSTGVNGEYAQRGSTVPSLSCPI